MAEREPRVCLHAKEKIATPRMCIRKYMAFSSPVIIIPARIPMKTRAVTFLVQTVHLHVHRGSFTSTGGLRPPRRLHRRPRIYARFDSVLARCLQTRLMRG